MVEALVGAQPTPELQRAIEGDLHAPQLVDVEVISALRGLELGGQLTERRALQALDYYWRLTIWRHPTEPLAMRTWQLRHQFTTYDACYIALAEGLDAPLMTCDRKFVSNAHRADVRVVDWPA